MDESKENFLSFLHSEADKLETENQGVASAIPGAAPSKPPSLSFAPERETGPEIPPSEGRLRHSIKKCACEACQEKRRQLAIQYGLIPDEEILEDEDETPDEEFVGKFLTLYHTYRYTTLSVKNKELAQAWAVASDTQETLGKLGHKVLAKWLRKAHWPYKTETILVLYLSTDVGIRFLEEAKIKALLDKVDELEAEKK